MVPSWIALGAAMLVAVPMAVAQPKGPHAGEKNRAVLSIVEAMRVAHRQSEQVGIARARAAGARAQVTRAKAARWPQVNGTASYSRTLASEFSGLFDQGAMDGLAMGADLPFGRQNIYRIGVTATEDLFTGGRITGNIDLAEAGRAQSEIAVAQARAQAVLTATEAYYDAVLSRDLLDIAVATLTQAERTLAQVRLSFSQGAVAEFDVLRAAVTRDNQRSLVVQRRAERDLAMLRLIHILDLPSTGSIVLTSDLSQPAQSGIAEAAREIAGVTGRGPGSSPTGDVHDRRAAIELAARQVRARKAALKIARAERWPSIQIGADFGLVNYPDDLFPNFDDWRTNFSVGVFLVVPIFSGGRITGDIRAAQADVAEAHLQLAIVEEQSDFSVARARKQVSVAHALWTASTRTIDQAERAYQIAELR
ncbi:MAG TPA: TolC family protein, partial [Kofleriaceae bacterium]|nr:TolC family protein [Kofleriaceae bacterium]